MNPNDLFLRSHARAESSQQPQHTHNTRGQASASNGASSSAVDQKPLDAQMMLDEAGAGAAEAGEGQKSRRELEQERKDLELAQLLEMMDDYKPVVSLVRFTRSRAPPSHSVVVHSCLRLWASSSLLLCGRSRTR